ALLWQKPEPDALWTLAASRRLWERRPGDDDFGRVRLALGAAALAVRLVVPETKPAEDLEPMAAVGLRRFINTFQMVPNLPIATALRGYSRIVVQGDRAAMLDLVRAVIGQLVTFHGPDE